MTDQLETPDNWMGILDVQVDDPTGWDNGGRRYPDARPWGDPITRDEFLDRFWASDAAIYMGGQTWYEFTQPGLASWT